MEPPAATAGRWPATGPFPRLVLVHCLNHSWLGCPGVIANSVTVVEHCDACRMVGRPTIGPWCCLFRHMRCCDDDADPSACLPPPLPPRTRPAGPPVPPRTPSYRPPIPPRRFRPLPPPPLTVHGLSVGHARNNGCRAAAPPHRDPNVPVVPCHGFRPTATNQSMVKMYDTWNSRPDLPRVVLYANARNLASLSTNRCWFSDGTVCGPDSGGKTYYEYNVRAVTDRCVDAELVVRAYLTERTVETYCRMFQAIKFLLPNDAKDPNLLVIHLKLAEMAVIRGARLAFRRVRVKACMAYTARTIWNMTRSCGVPSVFLETDRYKKQLERLLALAFVDPSALPAWYRTATDSPMYRDHAAQLYRFLERFRATYVGSESGAGPEFPPEVWNFHNEVVSQRGPVPGSLDQFTNAVGLPWFVRRCSSAEALWCTDEDEMMQW